jgi:hypothetical protein
VPCCAWTAWSAPPWEHMVSGSLLELLSQGIFTGGLSSDTEF